MHLENCAVAGLIVPTYIPAKAAIGGGCPKRHKAYGRKARVGARRESRIACISGKLGWPLENPPFSEAIRAMHIC
jgi:hypothetical protein